MRISHIERVIPDFSDLFIDLPWLLLLRRRINQNTSSLVVRVILSESLLVATTSFLPNFFSLAYLIEGYEKEYGFLLWWLFCFFTIWKGNTTDCRSFNYFFFKKESFLYYVSYIQLYFCTCFLNAHWQRRRLGRVLGFHSSKKNASSFGGTLTTWFFQPSRIFPSPVGPGEEAGAEVVYVE